MSFKNLLENFGHTANDRVEAAIAALKKGIFKSLAANPEEVI